MSNENPQGLFKPSNFDFFYKGVTHKRLADMKAHFTRSIKSMMEWEKAECQKAGKDPYFSLDSANKVSSLIDLCQDFYELEALRKCLFDFNIIPESYDQIKKAASVIR